MSTRLVRTFAQLSNDGFTPVSTTPPSPVQGPPSSLDGTLAVSGPGSFYSVPIWVDGIDFYRFVFRGGSGSSLNGSLRIETCCDLTRNPQLAPLASELATWIPQSFPVVQADGTVLYQAAFGIAGDAILALDEMRCLYSWVRMRLDLGAGSGSPIVRWCLKGDGGR